MEAQLPMNVSSTILIAFHLPSQCFLVISQRDCLSPIWASASSFQETQTKTKVILTMSSDEITMLSYGKGRFWRWRNTMLEPSLWWHLRDKLTLRKGRVSSLPLYCIHAWIFCRGALCMHPIKSMLLRDVWKRGKTAPPVERECFPLLGHCGQTTGAPSGVYLSKFSATCSNL